MKIERQNDPVLARESRWRAPSSRRPARFATSLPWLAVTLAVLAGGAALSRPGAGPTGGMMGSGMMRSAASMTISSEFQYLSEMIPHHQEAVAAARLLEAGTRRPEMRRFARTIIRTQTAEIEQMQRWLRAWYPGRQPAAVRRPMMRDLRGLEGEALDRAFLQDMPVHHMGAIMMSQAVLTRNLVRHPEVRPFALNIIATQRQENMQMMRWRAAWFGMMGMSGAPMTSSPAAR